MHEDLGTLDSEFEAVEDLGNAPEEVKSNGFSVRRRKRRRLPFLILLSAVFIGALTILVLHTKNDPKVRSEALPKTLDTAQKTLDDDEIVDMLASAKNAWELDDYERVITLCNEILVAKADHARAIYVRGASFAKLGHTEQAILDFRRAVGLDSSLASAHSVSYASAFADQARVLIDDGLEAIDALDLSQARKLFDDAADHAKSAIALRSDHSELEKALEVEASDWITRLEGLPRESPDSIEIYAEREWKSDAGAFSVQARFLQFDGVRVRLLKANGKTTSPPFDQLSRNDQEWLQQIRVFFENNGS
ncbi:MAG: hypothetical protein F9B45_08880 [Phycisphaera sp. RhM]|nr:hypothetical protein [Phycisphaera sp. RhM]